LDALFSVLYRLRDDGYAIILITHKLKEVLECADRITVLRNGRVAGSLPGDEADENRLVELMFAKKIPTLQVAHEPEYEHTDTSLLELRAVGTRGEGAETSLKDITLQVFPNEIVGVAGVSGNGQKELGDMVLGMINCTSGLKLDDQLYLRFEADRWRGYDPSSNSRSTEAWCGIHSRKPTRNGIGTLYDCFGEFFPDQYLALCAPRWVDHGLAIYQS
jgi:ABC-type uncharacterized transport system ATPase subunit